MKKLLNMKNLLKLREKLEEKKLLKSLLITIALFGLFLAGGFAKPALEKFLSRPPDIKKELKKQTGRRYLLSQDIYLYAVDRKTGKPMLSLPLNDFLVQLYSRFLNIDENGKIYEVGNIRQHILDEFSKRGL